MNWFRKDENGRWLWPGYGENSRVLDWVFERVSGTGRGHRDAHRLRPGPGAIDTDGLDVSEEDMEKLLGWTPTNGATRSPASRALRPLRGQAPGGARRAEVDTLEQQLC